MTRWLGTALISTCVFPAALLAQTAAPVTWPSPPAKIGQTAHITSTSGAEAEGKVTDVTADAIAIVSASGPRRFSVSEVARVEVRAIPWLQITAGAIVFGRIAATCAPSVGATSADTNCGPSQWSASRSSNRGTRAIVTSTMVFGLGVAMAAIFHHSKTTFKRDRRPSASRTATRAIIAS